MITLTPRSLELILDYAREDNCKLTQLKRAGLITTGTDDGAVFI